MKTRCLKQAHQELFKPKRFVFVKERPGEAAEKERKAGEKPKTLDEKVTADIEKKLKEPMAMDKNIDVTIGKLADKIDGSDSTKKQLRHSLEEGYNKWREINQPQDLEVVLPSFKDFWEEAADNGYKISVVRKNGEIAYAFETKDGKKWEPIKGAAAPIDVPAEREAPAEKPGKGPMRTIDEEAEKKEEERIRKEEEAKKVHKTVFGSENDTGGKMRYSKQVEKELQKPFVELEKIYPNAKEGDRVVITDYNGAKSTAVHNGERFEYTKPESKKGKEVKVRWNYTLLFMRAERKEKLTPPEGMPSAGHFRVKENMSWREIARVIMRTPDRPDGRDIKEGPGSPQKDNPAKLLRDLGYDYKNEADVAAYANLLKQHNSHDKLYVWVVIPKENPRVATELVEKQRKELKGKAVERTKGRERVRALDVHAVTKKNFNKLIKNEEYSITPKLVEVVDNKEHWNYFWVEGYLEPKEVVNQIKNGLQMLGVPMEKQRAVLYDAITQGSDEVIDFEDLLDAFDNENVDIYMNREKERGDYDDFYDEYVFYAVATKVKKGQKVSAKEREFYQDNYKEYVEEAGVVDVEVKYENLVNIVKGSALILDGLPKLKPGKSIEHAEAALEVREKRAEKEAEEKEEAGGKRLEREPWNARSPEERFLQQFFHPKNTKSLDEIMSAEEIEEGTSDFENRYSEETAYQMILLQSADPDNPTKVNRSKMVNIMNGYIRTGLARFFNLKRMLDKRKGDPELRTELQKLAQRYFGTTNLDELPLPQGKGSEMDKALAFYEIRMNLGMGNATHTEYLRNLLHDGFLASREIADGKIKLGEEITENKEWKNYSQILEKVQSEGAKELIRELMATQPKFRELPPEEFEKAVADIDAFMVKEHQWESGEFDRGIADLKKGTDNRLFDINAGVDANSGDWYLGLSKEILKIPGIEASLSLGIAVNPKTGEVLIGALLAKQFELSKQWSANIKGAAGVEVTRPKLTAGVSGGFTWMSKGGPESPWRDVVDFGAGFGSSISFNLTDVYMGPYLYVGYGQKKDFNEQASKLYTNAYLSNRFDMVDDAPNTKEKAQAIQRLPRGVGEFMIEMKYNLGWSDQELVKFYELHMKQALKNMSLDKTFESASGISEWGIGATIDPVKLTLLAIAMASGNPAIMGAVALGVFGKLGIIVDSSIKVERKLSDGLSKEQMAFEQRVVEKIDKMFPTVEVRYEVLRFKDMENVTSRNFAGSKLQRILGLPDNINPTSVDATEFNPEKTENFSKLQAEFAKHKLLLRYDATEKMYSIEPTMTQSYRFYLDPDIASGHALVVKGRKILIAAKEDLSNLHIRRFDVFYPGYVEGANQHTMITISDNPYVKMTQLAEQDSYMEVKYDRERGVSGDPRKVGKQNNILNYAEFKKVSDNLYKATIRTERAKETAAEAKKRAEHLNLTAEAFKQPKPLPENIDLSSLPMPPAKFSKMWQYAALYRKLTTIPPGGTEKDFEKLDAAIKKENPDITEDQLILYKEKLFSLSMSEEGGFSREVTINRRLQWARNAIFVPFFERKMKEKPGVVPEGVTAGELADSFLEAVREHIKNNPQSLDAGQALFTAVGTMSIQGIRMVEAASGQQNENNEFTEAIDYAQFLEAKGPHATERERAIARLLLAEHAEIPDEDTAFLQSRLAKKLFYMGREGTPNPLISVIGDEKYKQLIEAYKAIENGQPAPAESAEGIKALREIAEKMQAAQLGEGTPVILDGNRPGRAVIIDNYVFVIETTLKSGIYEYCKNPSVLYNETISVFSLPKLRSQAPEMAASVVSGAGDVVALETRWIEVWSIGLNAIGKYEIRPEVKREPPPPEKTPRVPQPVPRPKPGVGQVGGKTEGGATEGPGETEEGGAGV